MSAIQHTRVVAAIDFGTTFSGFAYAHKSNPREIFVHDEWQEFTGCLNLKTPTVIKYGKDDEGSFNLKSWGYSALAERPNRRNKSSSDIKPVERFKLHLNKMKNKPYLPEGLCYTTPITDYLREMGKVMRDTLKIRWKNVDFYEQVLIIMTIPAEFDNDAMKILRECAFEAKLIDEKESRHLKFTTEPEAAAVYCMKVLKELNVDVGSSFTVVDCGGGTVDLTTRRLLEGQKLGEVTERKGDYCGGSFVDDEFIKFLSNKVGPSAIESVMNEHYGQLQYMVQEFCRRVKFPFTGQQKDFKPFDLDLEELCPVIKQYVKDCNLDEMEKAEWNIELKFEDVKEMFDPVIERILHLIREQLDSSSDNISALLLVGGFSESKYLQTIIEQEFNQKLANKISVPAHPIAAIVKGAVQFGLRPEVAATRVLKWTYGTDIVRNWRLDDPPERRLSNGKVVKFLRLAERGDEFPVDKVISTKFAPSHVLQNEMSLDLYVTESSNAIYCDSPDVKLLDKWVIDVPVTPFVKRKILYFLTFGEIEIEATAFNLGTGDKYETTFELDIE